MSKLDLDFFENIITYKAITDESYLSSIVDYIKPAYFKNKDIKAVFLIIKEFFENRGTVPTLTEVKSHLTTPELKASFTTVVKSFTDLDKKFNNDELFANTETFLKEKAIFHTMMEVVDDINRNAVNTSVVLEKFEAACNISLTTETGLNLFEDVDPLVESINSEHRHISTGWSWLDEKIGGGFLETGRAMYIFTGETNIGKSIFLGNIATNIASQGKSVLLVSLEMPELIYAQRLSSSITKIPLSKLKSEVLTLKNQLEEYHSDNPNAQILIKEFPPSTITPLFLKSYIKKLKNAGHKFDAIVVDYVNLLNSPIGTNSYERVKHATEQLRALSYEFSCPVITATQLNRSGYSISEPGMNTISESIGLAQTADVIMSIWQEDTDRELGIIRMGTMKNRFGAAFGNCLMRIDYSTLSITEDEHINDTAASSSSANLLSTLSQ
jgi:replicative DNA helicase